MPMAPKRFRPRGRETRTAAAEKAWASRRAAYRGWYQLPAWRGREVNGVYVGGVKQLVLARDPVCRECERQGRVTPSTQVDHIRAHRGDWDLFIDPTNCQGLCQSCHSRKTVEEDGGFGR